jgi:hypothetical protein
MTYLEAIKAKLNYPLTDNAFTLALTDRGITASADYSNSTAFQLAYADTIMTLVTSPNVSEGGYSISLSEKESLKKLAQGIYESCGTVGPIPKPTAKFVQRW